MPSPIIFSISGFREYAAIMRNMPRTIRQILIRKGFISNLCLVSFVKRDALAA